MLCYDAGRRFFSRQFILFARARAEGDMPWRVGMAVSKKVGVAVVRNRVKRVLREVFRLHQLQMPPALDLVVVPRRSLRPDRLTVAVAAAELLPLLEEIRRLAEPGAVVERAQGTLG